jgi:hypothetical protein
MQSRARSSYAEPQPSFASATGFGGKINRVYLKPQQNSESRVPIKIILKSAEMSLPISIPA